MRISLPLLASSIRARAREERERRKGMVEVQGHIWLVSEEVREEVKE